MKQARWVIKPVIFYISTILAGILILMLLPGCSPSPDLRYEVIDQGEKIGLPKQGYTSKDSRLLIITSEDQINHLPPDVEIGSEIIQKAKGVDYQTNFVIILLRGQLTVLDSNTIPNVTGITRKDNVVTITAVFPTPWLVDNSYSSPYTIIKVAKKGKWGTDVLFYLNDQKMVQQYIPSTSYPYPAPSTLPISYPYPAPSIVPTSIPGVATPNSSPSNSTAGPNQISGYTYPPLPEDQLVFNAIVSGPNQSPDRFIIVNRTSADYPNLGRKFLAYAVFDQSAQQVYKLMIDLQTHEIVKDITSIQQAEDAAAQNKYGKFDPALFDRLKKASTDELIKVAIWIVSDPVQSMNEIYAKLAELFPEAKAAMARSKLPFDVDDPDLRMRIEKTYHEMMLQNTVTLIQPLVDDLQARGYTVKTFGILPTVTTELPKAVILEIGKRSDVGKIYLNEGQLGR